MFFKKRKFLWFITIAILITAPVIVLLTPTILSAVLFNGTDRIILITYGKSFIIYSLAFGIAFLTLSILLLVKTILKKIFLLLIGIISFIQLYSLGIDYYLYVSENYIEYNPLFGETHTYQWEDIIKIIREQSIEDDELKETIIFEFKDGNTIKFSPPYPMDSYTKTKLQNKILETNASYEEY